MTPEIVASDIEYATRLVKAGCGDSGIIAALRWRGVAEREAAQLVNAVRHGGTVPVLLPSPASRRHRPIPNAASAESQAPRRERSRRRRSHAPTTAPMNSEAREMITALGCVAVLIGLVYLFTVDIGTIPGREPHNSSPLVQDDAFVKAAQGLTNSAAQ